MSVVIEERIAGQWQPIADADNFELAYQRLAEIEAFYPTPEGTERYRVTHSLMRIALPQER